MTAATAASTTPWLHLVVPGQVIATSTSGGGDNDDDAQDGGFLRGHGTYLETVNNNNTQDPTTSSLPPSHAKSTRLVASVCGVVHRVNKLITVVPVASQVYSGHVGDLVVGRVTAVGVQRWRVQLLATGGSNHAQLPLTGVHLPGGVQRMRTTADQRAMRELLQEGDLVVAEVHTVQPNDGSLLLHTRSVKYGKLENGCLLVVPPALIPRRKNHYVTGMVNGALDVIFGTNGHVWMQRSLAKLQNHNQDTTTTMDADMTTTAETQERWKREHASTPVSVDERKTIARFRNAMECLRMVHAMLTPERVEQVYYASIQRRLTPAQMMQPHHVLALVQATGGGGES